MSSILNALRKLEEEQRPVDEGPLREDVALAPGRSPTLAPWAAALVGGLAVALVSALLIRSFWRTAATVPDPAPPSESRWTDPHSADRPLAGGGLAERRLAARRTEPHAPLPPSSRVNRAVDEAPVERATRSRSPVASSPAQETVASRRRPEPVVPSATPAARSATSPPVRPDSPSPAPARAAAPAPEPKPVQAAVAPPPPPVEVAAPKPAPMQVAQIAWHPDSDLRRAWLRVDGEKGRREVQEGDKVGNYTVLRIEPSSVLFQSGDIELRQPLGGKS